MRWRDTYEEQGSYKKCSKTIYINYFKQKLLVFFRCTKNICLQHRAYGILKGGRRGTGKRLNTWFKESSRSSGRRKHVRVQNVQTQMRSEIKYEYIKQIWTVHVLHSVCIAHITFSDKYIIIKSCFYLFNDINAALFLTQFWWFFVQPTVCFLHTKYQKTHLNWG